jgi:hypothetical protein
MMGPPSSRHRVARVLEQFAPRLGDRPWAAEPLGAGEQAEAYSLRPLDGRPAWRSEPVLVFKMYRETVPGPSAVAAEEFESLRLLNASLDGREFAGWAARAPFPLLLGNDPPALIMTRVPGRSINALLSGAAATRAPIPATLADAVAAALACFWQGAGRIYGDLDFNNILCDPGARTLSFVDPGMPGGEYLCEGVARDWFPASRDLAYLLFDVAVSVRSHLGRRAARKLQIDLAGAILLATADAIAPGGGKGRLLDEVHACTRVHLGRIRAGRSPAGAWRLFLKGHASRSLGRAIRMLGEAT